jgi:polysaccharide deacetylase family protein (PEP-CTERM system associated)
MLLWWLNIQMIKTNAITIDVEDYFQVSAFENVIDRKDWDSLEHRIERNIQKILNLLSDQDTKATFFTLGWIAERYPAIVNKIVAGGHELASHGYAHQRVSNLTKQEFKTDILKAKEILENISGQAILGYRAPSYSIGKNNIWAFKILAETGHTYSSSIYPVQHDHYGYPGAPRFAFRDQNTGLIEVPISTVKIMNRMLPVGGGGFFRFYPYPFSRYLINRVNLLDKQPTVFYLHPWELDPGQPMQSNISTKTRFRHYLNLHKTEGRLKRLLQDFNWGRMDEVFINHKDIPIHRLS